MILDEMRQKDLVEVVRCNDCRFALKRQNNDMLACGKVGFAVDNNHFCSYGERKDGADDDR